MNSNLNKFKGISLKEFIKLYHKNLHEEVPYNQAFTDLFKFKTFTSYQSTIKSITKSKTEPLPLYFDDPSSPNMQIICRLKDKVEKIFNFLDVKKIGRIDAYEFLTCISLVMAGNFDEKYWNIIASNFGVEMKDSITSDELFYFIDSLFRGLSKLLILKEDNPAEPVARRLRLDCADISLIVEGLLGGPDNLFVDKKDIKENAKKNLPELNEFLCYLHAMGQSMTKNKKEQEEQSIQPIIGGKKLMEGLAARLGKTPKS